ncbi:MAG: hypothetical protein PHE15_00100 [Dehalococcoidales bacterium]|nr:hypothetical protein [Dehalococcoidales bacterium]
MNEITCRGCGRYESECTCNVLTKDKLREIPDKDRGLSFSDKVKYWKELFNIQKEVSDTFKKRMTDLETINESHRKLNGELQARIAELEALILTEEDIELSTINKMMDIMLTKIWEIKDDYNYCHYITIAPPNPLCNTYQDGFIRGTNEGMSKLICAVAAEYNIKLEAKLQAIIEGDR